MDATRELTYFDGVRPGWTVMIVRVLAYLPVGRWMINSIIRSALAGGMR
jgi:hypothetical protein